MTAFPSNTPQPGSLGFTDNDLVRALFVTGRAPADRWSGASSVWEFRHRAAMTEAYVRSDPASRLIRSELAQDLDPSEKGYLSYSLGQALTTIFCEQVLKVDHMLHIQRYARHHDIEFGDGGERPDLFGLSGRSWVVAEAKGRSNAMESTLREKLTRQKRMVRTVNGRRPSIAVGCVAMFPAPERSMKFHTFDPEDPSPTAHEIELNEDKFMLAYYEPFLRVFESDHSLDVDDNGERASATLAGTGVTIGLASAVRERVERSAEDLREGLAEDVSEILRDIPGKQFPDGSFFETSWKGSLSLDNEAFAALPADPEQGPNA